MNANQWENLIAAKGSDPEAIAARFVAEKADLAVIFEGMHAKPARVKFGCEKVLRKLSEKHPALVYPCFRQIAAFLDSDNKILKWGAILTLANLAGVDSQKHFGALLAPYFALIQGSDMIAAANVIKGSVQVARAYPDLADRIAHEILKVEKARYKTPECRNVAIGHALQSLEAFWDLIKNKKPVLLFVKRQLGNSRTKVALQAAQLLKRISSKL